MVASLDFGLLKPLDLSQAVQAYGQARDRKMRQQQVDTQQQQVAATLARDEAAADEKARGLSAKKMAARALILGGMGGGAAMQMPSPVSGYGGGTFDLDGKQVTTPAMPEPMAAPAAPNAPMMAAEPVVADAEMVVSAPRGPSIWEQMIEADPDQAVAFFEKTRTMQDDERKRAAAAYDALAAATLDLANVPQEQRQQRLAQMAPALVASGIPEQSIAAFDLSDEGLKAAQNKALGLKEVFAIRDRDADNARADAQFAETERANRTRESLTVRGQNMTDARLRQATGVAQQANNIKLTEGQGKATGFLRLAEGAEATLRNVGNGAAVPGEGARMAYGVPFVERLVGGSDRQVLAAQAAFTEASLRFLTGAAVTRDEAARNVTQFFPAPGDTPEVVAQKAAYRQQVMAGMRDAAGPGAARVAADAAKPRPAQPAARQPTPRIKTDAEYDRLPSGAAFVGPDGKRRVKP